MTRIILVRHGETWWNQSGRYQGQSDIGLTLRGEEQAARIAERLRRVRLDAVYSSDLVRAVRTAEPIAKAHHLTVRCDADLREINYGAWEGLTYAEIMARYRELAEKWFSDPGDMRVPEGESLREVADRASRAILFIVDRHPGETVAVVSHGGTIRVIITAVLGLFLRSVWSFQVDNGSLSVIDFYPSRAVLVKLNDASHLETDNEF